MPEVSDASTPGGIPGTDQGTDVDATAARVEGLIADLGTHAARAKAEELVRVLVGLYGQALEQVMRIVTDAGAAEVLRRMTDDELVSGLLIVHDLHPLGTAERVHAALEQVRPHLGLHDGGVELIGVDPAGVVRLRLEGTCHGCPSSRLTVTGAIERAVTRAAPEVTRVDVEGLDPAPAAGPLLQIQRRPPGPCPADEQAAPTAIRDGSAATEGIA
ncbi:thioredoxin [Planotetraspora thailandica]|uniref:Thioredoxin n=1 Tax=Planotetraspora thailandica TaxID=487172 RepID=A0A8J3UV05_9ACTN|nr:NifU family protein [Planotetraspora thailandica]GII51887.1 thioredoxin [Planotetraspora thailandica]